MEIKAFKAISIVVTVLSVSAVSQGWEAEYVVHVPSENHPTIQAAVDWAPDYTEILLEPGVYTEEVDVKGKILMIRSASDPAVVRNPDGYAFLFHKAEGRYTILKNLILAGSKYGVFISDASPTLENLTIADNEFGIKGNPGVSPTISNCIFWNNTYGDLDQCEARYSCLAGGQLEDGNIDADPLFADSNSGDYRLLSQEGRFDPTTEQWVLDSATSPCINTGDPASRFLDEPMPNGERINMGAYGGTAYASKKLRDGGGAGTEEDPYQIWTAVQMTSIGLRREDWDKHFVLMADIDLAAYTGTQYNMIGTKTLDNKYDPFTGVFDGMGHSIYNLTWSSVDRDNVGLFSHIKGVIGSDNTVIGGIVRNVNLVDVDFQTGTGWYTGGIAGVCTSGGQIINCTVTGRFAGGYGVGGVVGDSNGDCIGCASDVEMQCIFFVGGVAGMNDHLMQDCGASGIVRGDATVGGLIGKNGEYGTVRTSYSNASVFAETGGAGGLAGLNEYGGLISNCYALGDVSGGESVGGLIGGNEFPYNDGGKAKIVNCYAAGRVITTPDAINVGGVAGGNNGIITNCLWDVQVTGRDNMCGSGCDEPGGRTTAEMKQRSTFAGWDFADDAGDGTDDIWTICEGVTYPELAWQKYGGGAGTEREPYQIWTAEQMNTIGLYEEDWDEHFVLMADIDLSPYNGTQYNIIGVGDVAFTGVFDGNGHRISNFSLNVTDAGGAYDDTGAGLFGVVSGINAAVTDLILVNARIEGNDRLGALAGTVISGTIADCRVTGGSLHAYTYNGDEAGGLVGVVREGATIANCQASIEISADEIVGGLVGLLQDALIVNCCATGNIDARARVGGLSGQNYGTIRNCYSIISISGQDHVGGICGFNEGTISNCYVTGSIIGARADPWRLGGLCGENGGTISNCYATSSVTGGSYSDYLGGLCGFNNGTINNCYTTGAVAGEKSQFFGGLCGKNNGGFINNCFWDIESSGQDICGTECDEDNGKTTAEMKQRLTFAGWDFADDAGDGTDDKWKICEGLTYPILAWQQYGGGAGTEEYPYKICTAEHMYEIRTRTEDWDKHFVLIADIDLGVFVQEISPVGTSSDLPFSGVFDGNGYTLSNLSMDLTGAETENVGLFGCVSGEEAVIKNLGLLEAHVTGDKGVGALAGTLIGGRISNCYVVGGAVVGNDEIIGGLVGRISAGGIVSNSYTSTEIFADEEVGGLAGINEGGTIVRCYATGDIDADDTVGGLVGTNIDGTIERCYATGVVWCDNYAIGGLVGQNVRGKISYCYALGLVKGESAVGGLVGLNYESVVKQCYSTGYVDVESSGGGLVGSNSPENNIISDCYWNVETSGQMRMCSLWSDECVCDDSYGKVTSAMKRRSTFEGWDFVNVWDIRGNMTYPYLRVYMAGDENRDRVVDIRDLAILAENWLMSDGR